MTRLISIAVLLAACHDTKENAQELITTVRLQVATTGFDMVFEWDDPDGDGGLPGSAPPVMLPVGTYAVTVTFVNRLAIPEEDITLEVRDEGFQHQVFFTGTAVDGPAADHPGAALAHSYADSDANGLPIGLVNNVTASAGSGVLTVTLRHMPPEQPPMKSADTAAIVNSAGFAAIGGSTDAQVDFMVTVP